MVYSGKERACGAGCDAFHSVARAAETARAHGATVVGLTGRGGGALRELSDLWIGADCEGAGEAEDVHLAICHAATAALRLPCSQAA